MNNSCRWIGCITGFADTSVLFRFWKCRRDVNRETIIPVCEPSGARWCRRAGIFTRPADVSVNQREEGDMTTTNLTQKSREALDEAQRWRSAGSTAK